MNEMIQVDPFIAELVWKAGCAFAGLVLACVLFAFDCWKMEGWTMTGYQDDYKV